MRRFILIAAICLISASARADGPRGLSLASNDETVAAEQPKVAETPKTQLQKADAPKAVEQPGDAVPQPSKADQLKPDQAQSEPAKPDEIRSASRKTEKPKFKRSPLEARVVYELHRNGIYW